MPTGNPFDQCLEALKMPPLSEAEQSYYRQLIVREYARMEARRVPDLLADAE